jgi:hypothetical protein
MVKRSDDNHGTVAAPDADDTGLIAELVRTLRIWPWDKAALRGKDPGALIGLVDRALVRVRRDGLAGHWAYDFRRHRALADLRQRLAIAARRRAQPNSEHC